MVYASATTVFVACDGGVFKGTISGGTTVSWSNLNAGGLSTLQFYGIGQHPITPLRIHGGLQDNGEAYTAAGASWSESAGGDGGFSATDWQNGEIAYEEYVYGAIARSTTRLLAGVYGMTRLRLGLVLMEYFELKRLDQLEGVDLPVRDADGVSVRFPATAGLLRTAIRNVGRTP